MTKTEREEQFFESCSTAIKAALATLSNKQLKQYCHDNLLPVSGTKKVLVERIWEYINQCKSEIIFTATGDIRLNLFAWRDVNK